MDSAGRCPGRSALFDCFGPVGKEHSRDVGTARELLDAVRSNELNQRLGVRCCTDLKAYLGCGRDAPRSVLNAGRWPSGPQRQPAAEWERERARQAALDSRVASCRIRELSEWPPRHHGVKEAAQEQGSRTPEREPCEFEDCQLVVEFADKHEEGILHSLAESLCENHTVQQLNVRVEGCTASDALRLVHMLRKNSTLTWLTMEARATLGWAEGERDGLLATATEALAHNACLQTLFMSEGVGYNMREIDFGDAVSQALVRNRCALEMAVRFGQLCKLHESWAGLASWSSKRFRSLLLSYFVPSACRLPASLEAYAHGEWPSRA